MKIFGESAIFSGKQTHRQRGLFRQHHCLKITRKESDFFIFKTYPHAGNKLLMLMILNLLNKLRHANEDLILEKQSDLDFNYVDNYSQEFISKQIYRRINHGCHPGAAYIDTAKTGKIGKKLRGPLTPFPVCCAPKMPYRSPGWR
ncbi:MAG: hypothetical protein R2861_10330 [Desulfobacterales bacterium]